MIYSTGGRNCDEGAAVFEPRLPIAPTGTPYEGRKVRLRLIAATHSGSVARETGIFPMQAPGPIWCKPAGSI